MSDEAKTQPTIQTLLEKMDALTGEVRGGFAAVEKMFDKMAVRLDRIDSEVKLTHSEFYELRADFREFRDAVREHFPAVR